MRRKINKKLQPEQSSGVFFNLRWKSNRSRATGYETHLRNQRYNYLIALGVSFVLAGMFMIALQMIDAKVSSSVLSIGITIIIIAIFRKIRAKSMPEKDERIKKLSMYGLGYSWITTFFVITIFFWFDYFGFVNITTQQYYSVVFVTMIISAIAFQRFLYKKGDIE